MERCREELEGERENANSPKARENATYVLRALEVFERSLNAVPIGALTLTLAPIYKPRIIEGVKISIQPTALISIMRPRGCDLRGAIIVDTAKGIEPKSDDARSRMTTAMMHSACLLHDHVANIVVQDGERSSADHCMIFHTHRQELVASPSNYKKLIRNVEAACRDIVNAWDNITPPSSFDPSKARYRN